MGAGKDQTVNEIENKDFNTDYILRELTSGVSLIHFSFIHFVFEYKCVHLSGTFVQCCLKIYVNEFCCVNKGV